MRTHYCPRSSTSKKVYFSYGWQKNLKMKVLPRSRSGQIRSDDDWGIGLNLTSENNLILYIPLPNKKHVLRRGLTREIRWCLHFGSAQPLLRAKKKQHANSIGIEIGIGIMQIVEEDKNWYAWGRSIWFIFQNDEFQYFTIYIPIMGRSRDSPHDLVLGDQCANFRYTILRVLGNSGVNLWKWLGGRDWGISPTYLPLFFSPRISATLFWKYKKNKN